MILPREVDMTTWHFSVARARLGTRVSIRTAPLSIVRHHYKMSTAALRSSVQTAHGGGLVVPRPFQQGDRRRGGGAARRLHGHVVVPRAEALGRDSCRDDQASTTPPPAPAVGVIYASALGSTQTVATLVQRELGGPSNASLVHASTLAVGRCKLLVV